MYWLWSRFTVYCYSVYVLTYVTILVIIALASDVRVSAQTITLCALHCAGTILTNQDCIDYLGNGLEMNLFDS